MVLPEPVVFRVAPGVAWLLALCGCSDPAPIDSVIAEIGGRPVALSQFEGYVRAVSEEDIPLVGGELKSALLEQLIEELLLLRAAEEEGIEVSPQEMQAMQVESSPDVEATQGEGGQEDAAGSPLDLEAHLRIKKLMDTKILKEVEVTDEDIAAHYEQNRVYYKRPAAVDISQILVETEEQSHALLAELRADASRFEELAREHSIGPEASDGGHLGTFRRGELPTSFEDEVFDRKRGELSGIVQTDFGFHIFRVNASYPEEDLGLDQVESTIRVELLRQKSDEALALFLDDLKRRYPVWIDTEKLDFPYTNDSDYDVEPRGPANARATDTGG